MMPAILVSTVLGLIRSMEAFEIELLLGVPIGLFVYSTKIRDLVAYQFQYTWTSRKLRFFPSTKIEGR